ncbi:MAG TPA: hypothetical protein VKX16_15250 [Chloroflexota bacterium]|nr:hypothetical protein [Chloroflexota bacterium]
MKRQGLVQTGTFGGLALLATVVATALPAQSAQAYVGGCRTDPVVVLSNVGTLDLSATINDTLSDVKQVVYVVHAPAGIHELAVVNTSGLMGLKETVKFYADDAGNTFDVFTTVYTGQNGVPVTANASVVSPLNLVLGLARTVPGFSGQALHLHVKAVL